MRRKTLAGLLALALLLGMAGCGKEEKTALSELAFVAAPNYDAQDVALPVDTGELGGCCTDGKSVWFLMTGTEESNARLYRADLEAGTAEVLEEYQPPEIPEDAIQRRYGPVLAPDGALWVYEEWVIYHYCLPEGFDPETDLKGPYYTGQDEFMHLRRLDAATGREKDLVDLSEAYRALELGETFGAVDFAVDGEGRVYLAGPGGVAVLDGRGKLLFALESETADTGIFIASGGLLALLPDGRMAVVTTRNGRRTVRPIDAGSQDWAEDAYPLPGDVRTVFAGREPCLFYYIQDDVLYGAVAGEAIPQRLLPLENTRMPGYSGTVCFALLDGGRLALMTQEIPDSGRMNEAQIRLALLSPTNRTPEDGKVRLVYGAIGEKYYIRNRIKKFNASSGAYYIEYRDYTEGALQTADSAEEFAAIRGAARLRLAGEIAAGRAPDILDGDLPLNVYAGAGYLEDLWPWIDGDPEISREGLMDHVLECAGTDGKLHSVGSSFRIKTAVASRAAAGNRTAWTLEEMTSAYGGTMPAIYAGVEGVLLTVNAEETLRLLLSMDLARYVDWETGECRFDGQDFRDLLRLCTSAGNGEDIYQVANPALWEGEPALCQATLSGMDDLVFWDVYFGGPESLSAGTYEQELWDAGVLYTFVSPYSGQEVTNYKSAGFVADLEVIADGSTAASGMPDRQIYASFAGVPTGGGAGSSFTLEEQMAISSASQAKEGAWEFIRAMLLPGGYLSPDSFMGMNFSYANGFPINRADFEALLEPRWCRVEGDGEIIPDKNGQPIEAPAEGRPLQIGEPIMMAAYHMAPTQAQMDRFWDLYNAIDHMAGGDEDLMNIIIEQALPYFAGDKSLAEAANLIQRRAKLYVNENR